MSVFGMMVARAELGRSVRGHQARNLQNTESGSGHQMSSRHRMAIKLWTGALASAGLLAFGGATASAATALLKVGSTPVIPHGARVVGALPSANKLNLTIALQPRNPAGLQALATEVS